MNSPRIIIPHHVKESLHWLRKRIDRKPSVAIILGSGLGDFARKLHNKVVIPTPKIPRYPQLTVQGHKGALVLGTAGKTTVLAFQGRVHFYEVGDLNKVLFPIFIAYGLQVKILLVTNAAGGVNRNFQPGDLMVITDQVNLSFEDPFHNSLPRKRARRNQSLYDDRIQSIIERTAAEKSIPIRRGIYCGVKGPSYETAAEVKMVRRLGGDAVGMSTVQEVSLAVALGMRVGGISCITNFATGITDKSLSHSEVTLVARKVKNRFENLIKGIIERL